MTKKENKSVSQRLLQDIDGAIESLGTESGEELR